MATAALTYYIEMQMNILKKYDVSYLHEKHIIILCAFILISFISFRFALYCSVFLHLLPKKRNQL